ncbi:hypothetical protein [Trichocoleus sp. FACHB-262]|nr:hypothetical protein [Trichocoleus sp. FACHB-262]
MGRKTVAKRATAAAQPAARVERDADRGKDVPSAPLSPSIGIFPFKA